MRRAFPYLSISAAALFAFTFQIFPASAERPKPKLVVAIMIDQFRYDYLTRFRSDYHGGLDRMLTHGADFTNALYAQVPTKTAVGHSIFLSGAMPAVSGIVDNAWYERDEKQLVTSVCDWDVTTVGAETEPHGTTCTDSDPASPKRLLVTTLGDELRNAQPDSKVIGISLKARGAILPSGHRAAGAYWFDDVSGHFISSTFYMKQLPEWAEQFNQRKLPAQYVDRKWDGFPKWDFHEPAASKIPFAKLPASPWGNELIEQFAERAMEGEKLGQRGATDLLTVSFSSNDYIGHAVGPDAPEVRDMSRRVDQLIGQLFQVIDREVGLDNSIVVLSADHGVATIPAQDKMNNTPGGYVTGNLEAAIETALSSHFGQRKWLIPTNGDVSFYLSDEAVAAAKTPDGQPVGRTELYRVAKEELLSDPGLHVSRVYSREQLDNGIPGDFIATAEMNGYYPRRSGDLAVVMEPGYMRGSKGVNHFSPYLYDRHVPVLLLGRRIKAGRYDGTIQPNDIAPTLATMLDIQTPSGSSGRVLTEALQP